MSYVPKKQRNNSLKWKIIIPLFMLVAVAVYFYNDYQEKQEAQLVDTYGICGLNNAETRGVINNYDNIHEVKDYFFYGETLNLYTDEYQLNMDDYIIGKTVSLVNLCTGEELVYMMEKNVDGQIPLEDLEEGVYEIFLNDSLDKKRVVYSEDLFQEFYTVTRNNSNSKITIQSDRTVYDDYEGENYLNDNYIYIIVEEEEQPDDYYDVIIDPGNNTKDGGYVVEYGFMANDLIEAEENMKLALLLKEDLEALGLKVKLSREEGEVVNSYGIDGKLYRGYQSHCRYFIEINQRAANNTAYRGSTVYYSSHGSNKMASLIMNELATDTSLIRAASGVDGVKSAGLYDGYDGMKMIRESGGKALAAGTFSEQSAINAEFNENNIFGMHAVSIEYIYLTNKTDVEVWQNEMENISEQTAEAFGKYLRIEGE